MEYAPKDFTDRLERVFDGRLRIRWSVKRHEWRIEQKVGRAALLPIHVGEGDDDLICARDGYAYVLTVRPGTKMPCPDCGQDMDVPALRFAETVCEWCRFSGKAAQHLAAYFPLSDLLIDHLKKISPERQSKVVTRSLDARNAALLKAKQREIENEGEAGIKDQWNKIVGIEQVGYTGKELKG